MRHLVGLSLALAFATGTLGTPRRLRAQAPTNLAVAAESWSAEELENLLAPIALYPDPILAQVLVAATYPEEIAAAATYVRRNGTDGLDDQPWNISVRAVAHYAPVLNLMAEGEEWTLALGQAYVGQPKDVMAAVQQLRRMAQAQGNLVDTDHQKIVEEREVLRIEPAQPRVIYVPTYDPAVVYFRPVYVSRAHPAHWSWGIGYPIGAWLTYDFDWWGPGVYYHGWYASGPRWVVVARPWVVISPIYVSTRHTTVFVNRRIVHRSFDSRPLRRYAVVHRTTTFDRHGRSGRPNQSSENPGRGDERRDWDRGRGEERRDANREQGAERRGAPVPMRGRSRNASDRVAPISTGVDKARKPRTDGTWNGRAETPARENVRNRTATPTRTAVPRAERRKAESPNGPSRDGLGGVLPGPTAGSERGTPRAERSAPRAERSTPRAERSAPRADRSAPRASGSGAGRSGGSPSRGGGSQGRGSSGRNGDDGRGDH
jgi:hypothetical protein